MRTSILFLIISTLLLSSCNNKIAGDNKDTAVTTYYFIRHAEKDRSDASNKDPELTEKGIARSRHWAAYFDSIHLDAVYSTNYKRTQQTAAPTALRHQLSMLLYDPGNMYDQKFKADTAEKNVLIVGHSNTTPEFVNRIIGSDIYTDMNDSDNESLYIVTISAKGINHKVERIIMPAKNED